MSQSLISRSPDLQRLRNEGYNILVRDGFLVVADVPYVNARREIQRGALVAPLTLVGEQTTRPVDHVVHFTGDQPCTKDGTPIRAIVHCDAMSVMGGMTVKRAFSNKPADGFSDHYEKFISYVRIISGPAESLDPAMSAQTYAPIAEEDESSPFQYSDSASSRADIVPISKRFEGQQIAIVGLGGTGSYVLDLVAKVPVREIHLFDGDRFLQHNAFRAPGAHSLEALRGAGCKAGYFRETYSVLHRGVVAHDYRIDTSNVAELRAFDFVFLCVDSGSVRKLVASELEYAGVPVIDVGMGVNVEGNKLTGILRVTTSTRAVPGLITQGRRVHLGEDDGDPAYSRNIQIADLNALNAALAVMKWKKLAGFYHDDKGEHHTTYSISTGLLTREEFACRESQS